MSDSVRVTVLDPRTGETETCELDPNSYILICGEYMEETSMQHWPMSGTVQITLRRRERGDGDG